MDEMQSPLLLSVKIFLSILYHVHVFPNNIYIPVEES